MKLNDVLRHHSAQLLEAEYENAAESSDKAADALDAAERYIVKRGHTFNCRVKSDGRVLSTGCTCGHDAVLKQIRGEG